MPQAESTERSWRQHHHVMSYRRRHYSTVYYMNGPALHSIFDHVGLGGALVELMPFVRRVMGLTAAIAAKSRPWASSTLTFACGALALQCPCCVGSASE